MKVKTFLLLTAVLLVTASASFGAALQMMFQETTQILTKTCTPPAVAIPSNGVPYDLTKGMVWVYRDWMIDGLNVPCNNLHWWRNYTPGGIIQPTPTSPGDTILPLCPGAPVCNAGSQYYRLFTMNQFPMDNSLSGKPLGEFVAPRYVKANNNYPATASHVFFLVVTYKEIVGVDTCKVVWISNMITASDVSTPVTYEVESWCCVDTCILGTIPCVDPGTTYFAWDKTTPDPIHGWFEHQSACVNICKDIAHTICVGPLNNQPPAPGNKIPHVEVVAGCVYNPHPPLPGGITDPTNSYCDFTCTPVAAGFVWPPVTGWTLQVFPGPIPVAGTYYCRSITWAVPGGGTNGCVCITLDYIEPVGMGDMSLIPLDNAVKVRWNTHSETNLDKWIVKRDNVAIYQVDATNTTTEHNYEYVDADAVNGHTYSYSLVAKHSDASEEVVRVLSVTPSLEAAEVTEYALRQNYPNPFNPTTKILYDVLNTNPVTLKIYNAAGQEVTTLLNNESKTKGRYSVTFDATNLPSGLYFYNIKIGTDFSATKKMLLVK